MVGRAAFRANDLDSSGSARSSGEHPNSFDSTAISFMSIDEVSDPEKSVAFDFDADAYHCTISVALITAVVFLATPGGAVSKM